MSYLPYSPDVSPPAEAVPESPWRRRRPWLLALGIYLLGLPVFVWWVQLPPRLQPPLATIPWPDGTELRWVGSRQGPRVYFSGYYTFENRVRLDDHIGYYGGWHVNGTTPTAAWLVFARFHPHERQRFSAPTDWLIEVVEDGSSFTFQPEPREQSGSSEMPYEVLQYPVIPRGTPNLRLRASRGGKSVEGVIKNPFYTAQRPQFVSAPMPQRKEVDGFVIDLERVTLGKLTRTSRGVTTERPTAQPVVRVTHRTAPAGTYSHDTEWFDGTGNVTERGLLPMSEPVWGLRVRVEEDGRFPFPADRMISLGKGNVPAAGQATQLTVPSVLAKQNVSDVLLLGPGSYHWTGGQLLSYGTAGQASTVLLQLRHQIPMNHQFSASAWCVCVISSRERGAPQLEEQASFRVRSGESIFDLRKNMTSNFGYGSMRHFSMEGGSATPIGAGTSVEVELTFRKKFAAEFFIPRPELEKK